MFRVQGIAVYSTLKIKLDIKWLFVHLCHNYILDIHNTVMNEWIYYSNILSNGMLLYEFLFNLSAATAILQGHWTNNYVTIKWEWLDRKSHVLWFYSLKTVLCECGEKRKRGFNEKV